MSEFKDCVYRINFKTEEERIANFRSLMAKLDAEGFKNDAEWNSRRINDPDFTFLRCYEDGRYSIYDHDCNYKNLGLPIHHWPDLNGWTRASESLPEPLKTIWMTDGVSWVDLGCRIDTNDGWTWATPQGLSPFIENGEIVAHCYPEDLNVVFWKYAPKLPKL